MKKTPFIFAAVAISLSACMQDVMLATNPNQAIDLMKGAGNVSRSPDGATTFRFVIGSDVYDGIIDNQDELREQHNLLISSWVGTQDICPNGYSVGAPQEVSGVIIYEGRCK